ncbi:T9SS type A sorting domain-containing protein [Roseivirga sp. UBA1976]|uniref:T9SS type A sorting domain-containing protein n=1 Tax=Roseivirga sp. UBA1976 TaxID=1947386 RepID=UPI00257F07C4|nr:T9SS type A sorting domain-containing protein [Roseivirga sp. UBA1976]
MRKIFVLLLSLGIPQLSLAQQAERLDVQIPVICYASDESPGTRIFHNPAHYARLRNALNHGNSTRQRADIRVEYNGFSEEAKAAFQAAVDIWAGLISSPVPIRINATWQSLDEGVLGSAIWNTAFRNFDGAKQLNTWYPVALAEKMARQELNSPNEPDIVANFNSRAPWYLGTDGNPAPNQFDLVTVVLHEIGHGLGFVDSFNYSEDSDLGTYGIQEFPFIFDLSVENSARESLVEMGNNTVALGNALSSNAVYFNSPTSEASTGTRPRLYAPNPYDAGSSIAHLNENTYASGNANSLMTPQIGFNEVMHDPGPVTLDMFGDMGWELTYIDSIDRPNTEDITSDTYTITAKVFSDIGFNPNEVRLFYSTDGFVANSSEVQMTSTNNANEFSAQIQSAKTEGQVYTYYITAVDDKGRQFSRPSVLVPERYLRFQSGNDSEAPIVSHTPPNFIRTTDQGVTLETTVTDFLPVDVTLEYAVNGGTLQSAIFRLANQNQNLYRLFLDLSSLNLADGDYIEYRIKATDQAAARNETVFPATGFTKVNVVATAEPRHFYFNDFNNISEAAEDFFTSANFSIREEATFENGAIHSDHPYADGTGSNNESNYTFELKIPIIVNEQNAKMSFDEVVLVEPGEANSEFGDNGFYDYVIVEASKNGGETWLPLLDGYDSRVRSNWFSRYQSSLVDNNSTAVGESSIYAKREIDLLASGDFEGGDELLIRFRLFADEAAHGWGWAIDNLNIQMDVVPPTLRHQHFNYASESNSLSFDALVTDNVEVDSVALYSEVNGQPQPIIQMTHLGSNLYRALVDITALNEGDVIEYRIAAFDSRSPIKNASFLPGPNEFFSIPLINFGNPVTTYSNNFNEASEDFVGNFFGIETPSGFSNGAIHSRHPYPSNFGLSGSTTFTYTLKKPITVSATMPYIAYDEIALVDPVADYAALEVSKDGGQTWLELRRSTANTESSVWGNAFAASTPPEPSMFRTRLVKLTDNAQINAGDEILLRFRLERRGTREGWGWAIDNLQVQNDQITAIDNTAFNLGTEIFPNPVTGDLLYIKSMESSGSIDISLKTMNGLEKLSAKGVELDDSRQTAIDISGLPSGLYILRVVQGRSSKVFKVLKLE